MHCKICGKKSDESRICKECDYFLKKGIDEATLRRMYSDGEANKIWKENEKRAEALAEAYYESVIEQFDPKEVKKDSKENFGYNTFAWGIKAALDIILPMLNQEMREEVEKMIKDVVELRKHQKEKLMEKDKLKR